MCAKIPNTLRGSGKDTTARAGKITLENIRKEHELERELKRHPLYSLLKIQKKLESNRTREKVKRKNRTMLWP